MDADHERVYFTLGEPNGELFTVDISGLVAPQN
jgi:hypothetical protein